MTLTPQQKLVEEIVERIGAALTSEEAKEIARKELQALIEIKDKEKEEWVRGVVGEIEGEKKPLEVSLEREPNPDVITAVSVRNAKKLLEHDFNGISARNHGLDTAIRILRSKKEI